MNDRRTFLKSAGLLGLGATIGLTAMPQLLDAAPSRKKSFARLKVSMDRVIKETVGLRPFRPSGFRLGCEQLGSKTIVHNYGHGGSGWSLSWGTGNIAADMAAQTGEKKFAVLGCGVVGIATARLLQMRGFEVTIYTKDLPPKVTSSMATGTWSPSYTLAEADLITPEFAATWEKACLFSFRTYQNLLGFNDIVGWKDNYTLGYANTPAREVENRKLIVPASLPQREMLTKKDHPFRADTVSRQTTLVFNIPAYLDKHLTDFLSFGGKVVIRSFQKPEDVDALSEKCVVNCTGLGAKEIFQDEELTPVAGQLTFLVPQPDFNYRLSTPQGYAIPRKDGIVLGGNAIKGSWDTTPKKEQTEKVIAALDKVMKEMRY
jgi:hypothetical protein